MNVQSSIPHLIPLGWHTHEKFEVQVPDDVSYTPEPDSVFYSYAQKPIPYGIGLSTINLLEVFCNKHPFKRKHKPMIPHSLYFKPGTLLVPIKSFPVANLSASKYQVKHKNETVVVIERVLDSETDCLLVTALDSQGDKVVFKMLEQDIESTYNLYFNPQQPPP